MLICVFNENVKKSVVCQGNRVMSLFNRISCFDNEMWGAAKAASISANPTVF